MRIVFDLDGAYPDCEGPLSYSLNLAKGVIACGGDQDVYLVLDGRLRKLIEKIRDDFRSLLPQDNIRVWFAPEVGDGHSCSRVRDVVHEAVLVSLEPDVIHFAYTSEGSIFRTDLLLERAAIAATCVGTVAFEGKYEFPDVETLNGLSLCILSPPLSIKKFHEAREGYSKIAVAGKASADADLSTFTLEAEFLIPLFDKICGSQIDKVANVTPRQRLAFISPLPPERTGIATYSQELLAELTKYYDIDLIVAQPLVELPVSLGNLHVRSVEWFRVNAWLFSRVIYQFGNSHFHSHMFELLRQYPGVTVLHDLFLGNALAHKEYSDSPGYWSSAWVNELYESHGYDAVSKRLAALGSAPLSFSVTSQYPCSAMIFAESVGVLTHSAETAALARKWYGKASGIERLQTVPLLRARPIEIDRSSARSDLGFKDTDFVVCSFGQLSPVKLCHKLLSAWISSELLIDESCHLVFVGECPDESYLVDLKQLMAREKRAKINIVGWSDDTTYKKYLCAADLAVQLRGSTRGETSASALDCMNYGLPTIVNSREFLSDLSADSVVIIPADFQDADLRSAIEELQRNVGRRNEIGQRAAGYVRDRHSPSYCAERYATAVERFYARNHIADAAIVDGILEASPPPSDDMRFALAEALTLSLPIFQSKRRLFVDVSAAARSDLKTGIERVVRAVVMALIEAPVQEFRVEPVYLAASDSHWYFRFARTWTLQSLGFRHDWISDDPIDMSPGDVLLVADFHMDFVIQAERDGLYRRMREHGVDVHFVVYDLLPIALPHMFPTGTAERFEAWLNAVCRAAHSALCISKSVASDFEAWRVKSISEERTRSLSHTLNVDWFHLGADFTNTFASHGLPNDSQSTLDRILAAPSFLMVGTVEPRKGHAQVLHAFERLWAQEINAILVIVGKAGWMIENLAAEIRGHPTLGDQLFWFEGVSDEYLERIYEAVDCLIMASEGEGYGLPLIEAARHGVPIIARDISVFREVAGDNATYFEGLKANDLAETIIDWLKQFSQDEHIKPFEIPWLTWQQSAEQLLQKLRQLRKN